ncbi:hypothetical protein FACS1894103_7030 [Campylobacterota bacterium]|nr:hypothetical protein FACS1894103_7030 [Campylobacterota bacterium]
MIGESSCASVPPSIISSEANGKFKSIEELTNVKGIGKGILENIKDEVEVAGK